MSASERAILTGNWTSPVYKVNLSAHQLLYRLKDRTSCTLPIYQHPLASRTTTSNRKPLSPSWSVSTPSYSRRSRLHIFITSLKPRHPSILPPSLCFVAGLTPRIPSLTCKFRGVTFSRSVTVFFLSSPLSHTIFPFQLPVPSRTNYLSTLIAIAVDFLKPFEGNLNTHRKSPPPSTPISRPSC
jgi:hypothetical protein